MAVKEMTGVILAGGRNTRMGTNKAFLNIDGSPIIEHTVNIFRRIFGEVLIVTNTPFTYLHLKVAIVTDIVPNKGPLGGLFTGLFFAYYDRVFACACDMPFMDERFIEYMTDQSASYDIVVPDAGDGMQPLHAIYGRQCLPAIRNALRQERLKLTGFFKGHQVLTIPTGIINRYDHGEKMFLNVNTAEDLREICEITW